MSEGSKTTIDWRAFGAAAVATVFLTSLCLYESTKNIKAPVAKFTATDEARLEGVNGLERLVHELVRKERAQETEVARLKLQIETMAKGDHIDLTITNATDDTVVLENGWVFTKKIQPALAETAPADGRLHGQGASVKDNK